MSAKRTRALMLAVVADYDDESLGRFVREIWIEWAQEQPNPKPSWLVPWEGLSEPDKEVDRRIGRALFRMGRTAARSERDEVNGPKCIPCGDTGVVMTARVVGGLPCPNCDIARTVTPQRKDAP